MKAPAAISLLIIAGILLVFLAWALINHFLIKRRARLNQDAPWRIEEDAVGQTIQVQLVKPGEEPMRIGDPIPVALPHWEYLERMEEVRAEAEDKLNTINRRTLK